MIAGVYASRKKTPPYVFVYGDPPPGDRAIPSYELPVSLFNHGYLHLGKRLLKQS